MEADIIRSGANEVTGSPASDWLRDISGSDRVTTQITRQCVYYTLLSILLLSSVSGMLNPWRR